MWWAPRRSKFELTAPSSPPSVESSPDGRDERADSDAEGLPGTLFAAEGSRGFTALIRNWNCPKPVDGDGPASAESGLDGWPEPEGGREIAESRNSEKTALEQTRHDPASEIRLGSKHRPRIFRS